MGDGKGKPTDSPGDSGKGSGPGTVAALLQPDADAIAALNAALGGVAALTAAIYHMQQAAKDIDTATGNAIEKINGARDLARMVQKLILGEMGVRQPLDSSRG